MGEEGRQRRDGGRRDCFAPENDGAGTIFGPVNDGAENFDWAFFLADK